MSRPAAATVQHQHAPAVLANQLLLANRWGQPCCAYNVCIRPGPAVAAALSAVQDRLLRLEPSILRVPAGAACQPCLAAASAPESDRPKDELWQRHGPHGRPRGRYRRRSRQILPALPVPCRDQLGNHHRGRRAEPAQRLAPRTDTAAPPPRQCDRPVRSTVPPCRVGRARTATVLLAATGCSLVACAASGSGRRNGVAKVFPLRAERNVPGRTRSPRGPPARPAWPGRPAPYRYARIRPRRRSRRAQYRHASMPRAAQLRRQRGQTAIRNPASEATGPPTGR
jgi:hypothetical protein